MGVTLVRFADKTKYKSTNTDAEVLVQKYKILTQKALQEGTAFEKNRKNLKKIEKIRRALRLWA